MNQRGVTLINLIITVIIIGILAGTAVFVGIDYTQNAQRRTLDMTISNIKNEVALYKTTNNQLPIKRNPDTTPVTFDIDSVDTLKELIEGTVDEGDTFYVVDLEKLKATNQQVGLGADPGDVFIMAKRTNDVYYAKGRYINEEEIYHGKAGTGKKLDLVGTVKFDEGKEDNFKEEDTQALDFKDGYVQLHKNE